MRLGLLLASTASPHAACRAEIFNPTCNSVVLDSYGLLFITATQGVPGDGDWSEATAISFPAGTTLAVRSGQRAPAARTALPRAHQPCTVPLRANTRRSVEP